MFHPCRLLVFLTLVFVSLLASSPAFAARDTPEDEKSLTIRNESAEELLSIRFTVGNQANYARLDLLPSCSTPAAPPTCAWIWACICGTSTRSAWPASRA